jgi:hypothetical protein
MDKPKKKRRPHQKYNPLWHPQLAFWMSRNGLTDQEMAGELHIVKSTLNKWKLDHPEFREALKNGKKEPDDLVEICLFQRATGYSYPEDKILQHNGQPIVVPTIKHVPPDVTAQIWWLKNRRPDKWRDKHEVSLDVPRTFADWLKSEITNDDGDQEVSE